MNTPKINYEAHGFKDTGFGCTVRATEISVWIVRKRESNSTHPVGVYIFHGAPAGQFWRSSKPLLRCKDVEEAKQKAETIFGITGSQQFANIIDAQ